MPSIFWFEEKFNDMVVGDLVDQPVAAPRWTKVASGGGGIMNVDNTGLINTGANINAIKITTAANSTFTLYERDCAAPSIQNNFEVVFKFRVLEIGTGPEHFLLNLASAAFPTPATKISLISHPINGFNTGADLSLATSVQGFSTSFPLPLNTVAKPFYVIKITVTPDFTAKLFVDDVLIAIRNSPVSPAISHIHLIAARNGAGANGDRFAADDFLFNYLVPPLAPSEPTSLVATGAANQIGLAWITPTSDGGSPLLGYKIFRSTSTGFIPNGATLLATVGVTNTFNDTSVIPGTAYFYVVKAFNTVGDSPASNEDDAISISISQPPFIYSIIASDQQIQLKWNPPIFTGGGVTNYRIYRDTNPNVDETDFLIEIGNVLEFLNTGLINGTTYYYRIKAKNAAGNSAFSNLVSATPVSNEIPATPVNIFAISRENHTVIAWNAVTTRQDGTLLPNLAIYNIYVSHQMNENDRHLLRTISTLDINNQTDTVFVDVEDFPIKVYRITAVVIDGTNVLESELSERAVAIRLPSQIDDRKGLIDQIILKWDEGNWDETVWS